MQESDKLKWGYLSYKHYLNHLHFFRWQPLLIWRTFLGYFKTIILKRKVLRSIELAVIYDCQLRCSKCFALKWMEEKKNKPYLTVEQIKNIFEQAYKLGAIHINLTGGEPLLRKDISDIIKVCKPKGTLISLVTNGILLTEEKARELKKAGLNTIQISLDSSKSELHDKYRGFKGSYNKVMAALENAKKAGLNVCFTTVATHENIYTDEIKNMLELAKQKKVMLLINHAGIVGGWSKKDNISLSKEDRKTVNGFMKHPYARVSEMFNFYNKPGISLLGKDKINISAYGDIYPCTYVMLKFGNALEEPIKDIWYKMADFKYFKGFTADTLRIDNKEFIREYIEPLSKSRKPILTVEECKKLSKST